MICKNTEEKNSLDLSYWSESKKTSHFIPPDCFWKQINVPIYHLISIYFQVLGNTLTRRKKTNKVKNKDSYWLLCFSLLCSLEHWPLSFLIKNLEIKTFSNLSPNLLGWIYDIGEFPKWSDSNLVPWNTTYLKVTSSLPPREWRWAKNYLCEVLYKFELFK